MTCLEVFQSVSCDLIMEERQHTGPLRCQDASIYTLATPSHENLFSGHEITFSAAGAW